MTRLGLLLVPAAQRVDDENVEKAVEHGLLPRGFAAHFLGEECGNRWFDSWRTTTTLGQSFEQVASERAVMLVCPGEQRGRCVERVAPGAYAEAHRQGQ